MVYPVVYSEALAVRLRIYPLGDITHCHSGHGDHMSYAPSALRIKIDVPSIGNVTVALYHQDIGPCWGRTSNDASGRPIQDMQCCLVGKLCRKHSHSCCCCQRDDLAYVSVHSHYLQVELHTKGCFAFVCSTLLISRIGVGRWSDIFWCPSTSSSMHDHY